MNAKESMKISGRTYAVLALVLSLTPGCITEPDSLTDDASNTIVQIVNMGASDADFEGAGDTVTDLFSDVCFADEDHPPCTIFNDNGVVTMRAIPKDRTQLSGEMNAATFTRYRVTYVRADGRNVQGVDVPYSFDGAINFTVPFGGDDVERAFIVVRHQAKAETPLRELALGARAGILSVIAQIDFFGADTAGRSIHVTGYLNITFADFGNE
ncbi:MAG: hypothetical protein ACRD3V_12815 [Vicinamibacteria bacterium]